MSLLAPTLQAFFTERLVRQRQASSHTIAAYRDTWRLLVAFASSRLHKAPSALTISDLDAPLIAAFLDHAERDRGNTARTRNARLAAIRALFRYAALGHPEQAAVIARVLTIPAKRFERRLVTYLIDTEADVLLAAPDRTTWTGRRNHAWMALAIQTGLRASELIRLRGLDLHLEAPAHVSCLGKGRKQRITPLTKPIAGVLRSWLTEGSHAPDAPLFPTHTGRPLSRDALERRLAIHAAAAAVTCPSLREKRVTPHVLRHTAAMRLLHAGVDTSVIALWLGHEQVDTTLCICRPISPSRSRPWPERLPPMCRPGGIDRQTRFWLFFKRSDYADAIGAAPAADAAVSAKVGIIRRSA